MRNSFFCYCLLFLTNIIASTTQAQQTFKTTANSVIGYLEYLPQDYNSNSNKYPIVIFLHGLGERGVNSIIPSELQTTILTVAKNGPPKYVKSGTQFPFILISPQLKNNYSNWPVAYIKEVIDYCKTYLRIDEQRIYLTGLSLGGGGTWSTAQDYAKTFAAIAPVCGSSNAPSKACNLSTENLPVWAFHGDADGTVNITKSVNMVNAINACTPAPSPLAKLTIYPGVTHNAWDNAYKTDNSLHTPNVYEWMLSYTNTINGTNKTPLANAGSDLTYALSVTGVTISGSGTDSDGTISSYTWSQISGPSQSTLTNSLTSKLSLSGLAVGVYMYKLTVGDNNGDTNSDYVKVTIQVNSAPTVSAGSDKSVVLPTDSVTIVGSAIDPDGSISSYKWSEVSGPAVQLSGATTPSLSVSSLMSGSYVFRLTVKDNLGAAKSDEVEVNVLSPINLDPIVSAGPDRVLKLPSDPATLFGTASDSDGTITSYQWTLISGGSYNITSSTVLRPKISELLPGTYVFKITITDDGGATATDEVTVIADYPANVSAGGDKTITLPVSSVTLNGTATDDDGTIKSYAWTKYSGPTAVLANQNTSTLTVSSLIAGTYIFKLTVTDNIGVQSIDYATVTVLSASGARSAANIANTILDENGSVMSNSLFDSGNILENTVVTVYNEKGIIIFAGKWSDELYQEVFNKQGLYVYKLFSGTEKATGKVYINR